MQNNNLVRQGRNVLDNAVQNDPLRVDEWGKSRDSQSKRQQIYMCLFAIPLLIAVGLIFFMISSIDGALFGTPEDELNGIIDNKIKSMV